METRQKAGEGKELPGPKGDSAGSDRLRQTEKATNLELPCLQGAAVSIRSATPLAAIPI